MNTDLIKRACHVLLFIAAVNIALGVASLFGVDLGFNWTSLLYGLLVGLCGGVAYKTRSLIAIGVGGALMLLDLIILVAFTLSEGYTLPVGGLVIRVALLGMVFKPIVDDLRARRHRNF